MIYLSELFGKQFSILIQGKSDVRKYRALLSKNTIKTEKPYRITRWSKNMKPMGHIDINKKESTMIFNGVIPSVVQNRFHVYANLSPGDIISII